MIRKARLFQILVVVALLFIFGFAHSGKSAVAAPLQTSTHSLAPSVPLDMTLSQNFTQVAAGYQHNCALTLTGGVKCWGINNYGQLGDGKTSTSWAPVDVIGLNSSVIAIAAGFNHTCVLTDSNGVKCWGANYAYQLGDGTGSAHASPTDVSGLTSDIKAITAGMSHTCALTTSGAVKCWGDDSLGQLGDNMAISSTTTFSLNKPVDVIGLNSGIRAIATGYLHTCALLNTGNVKCWGSNNSGQLGDGTTILHATPTDVVGLSGSVDALVAGGDHTCAILTSGGIQCWGANQFGQLGDGTTINKKTPVNVIGLSNGVNTITTGGYHTCIVLNDSSAKCWGYNLYGQLGDNTLTNHATPVDVINLSVALTDIKAGEGHTCAVTVSHGIKCWGDNQKGQLGDGSALQRNTPTNVIGLAHDITAIGAGIENNCALTNGGGVKCWGTNLISQSPNISSTYKTTTLIDIPGLNSDVTAIAGGVSYNCVIVSKRVKCWGDNTYGQLGDGTTIRHYSPVDVIGITSDVITITVGAEHTCALTSLGKVKCWGWNNYGQLGDGTTIQRDTPVDVVGLSNSVIAITAGNMHTCALSRGGSVKCWGDNSAGQIGDGTNAQRYTPVNVQNLTSGVIDIAAGAVHTCALTNLGGLKCWGQNEEGELGDDTGIRHNTPVDVVGLTSQVIAVTANNVDTCALTNLGTVKCWGWNGSSQVGDATTTTRFAPVDVVGLTAPIRAIAGKGYSTCALTSLGSVQCWGDDGFFQLGVGRKIQSSTPVDVVEPSGKLCYGITLFHTGSGSDLVATPTNSSNCLYNQYWAGEVITLTATPVAGGQVTAWSGTANDSSTAITNTLIMPAGNQQVSITYSQVTLTCYPLTLFHTGLGNDPVATPTNSAGCASGQYLAGEVINFSASPAAGWEVKGWQGTVNDASTTRTNTLTMPANAQQVKVFYQSTSASVPWVVLVYLNGDNNLDGETVELFNQLEVAVASDPSLVIRVLWDRAGNGNTVLYQVQPDQNPYALANYQEGATKWTKPELDMGQHETLLNFILSTRQSFPGDQFHYLLSIVDHGGGWSPLLPDAEKSRARYAAGSSGLSLDETSGYHYLSTHDMGAIFAEPTLQSQPLDIVFYDACLMAMVEEAYGLRNSARFFLASEYEAWTSWPYADYLKEIQIRTAPEQARWMVDKYDTSLIADHLPHTLSAVDLQYTEALISTLNQLATALDQNLSTQKAQILAAFLKAQKLDYNYDFILQNTDGYVDLGDFAKQLKETLPGTTVQTTAQAVLDVLQGNRGPYIFYEKHASGQLIPPYPSTVIDVQGATGISIYLPLGEDDRELPFYRGDQISFAQATSWDKFIFHFKGILPSQGVDPNYIGGRGHKPEPLALPSSPTLTPTVTPTPTATATLLSPPTITSTPTATPTATVSQYTVDLPIVHK